MLRAIGPSPGSVPRNRASRDSQLRVALTDAQGKYELKSIGDRMGALLGVHQVRITKFRMKTYDHKGKVADKGVPEQFPKTANTQSTLTAKVGDQDNVVDVPIKSK